MSIEAMKQAYEVPLVEQLESVPNNARLVIDDADGMGTRYIPVGRMCHDASKALRQAIAKAKKQEPVAFVVDKFQGQNTGATMPEPQVVWTGQLKIGDKLYTTPQQRKPLTDEMTKQMKERCDSMEMRGAFADGWLSAEAAHGIKENT